MREQIFGKVAAVLAGDAGDERHTALLLGVLRVTHYFPSKARFILWVFECVRAIRTFAKFNIFTLTSNLEVD